MLLSEHLLFLHQSSVSTNLPEKVPMELPVGRREPHCGGEILVGRGQAAGRLVRLGPGLEGFVHVGIDLDMELFIHWKTTHFVS